MLRAGSPVGRIFPAIPPCAPSGGRDGTVERTLARLASRAWGVVTRTQLRAAGISKKEIEHRLAIGSLIRLHRACFALGTSRRASKPPTWPRSGRAVTARPSAAVRPPISSACSEAVRAPPPPEVTCETNRRVRGVRTKRARAPLEPDVMTWRGIPVTTVARTIVDLAAVLSLNDLALVCHEAGVKHGTTPGQVKEVLARRPSAKGASKLRLIFEGDAPALLSRLEKRLPQAPHRCRPAPPRVQPPRRRTAGRLPVGLGAAHCRARQLHLPQLPPRLGTGPPP